MKLCDFFECPNCDGVGWVEGGKTLKTTCRHCKGYGALLVEPGGVRRVLTTKEADWLRNHLAPKKKKRACS